MTSRICNTSWSLSCDTRRSSGIFTFSMISAAFFWPMPWMYWSAIRTRLLVGIFTPAIRATDFSPVAAPLGDGHVLAISGRCPQTRTRRPSPWMSRGPASFENYPTWIRALLRDSIWFRQPSLCLSSLFSDLFGRFPGLPDDPGPGTRRRLADRLFRKPGSRFAGLPEGPGDLPGGLGGPGSGLGGLFGGRFGTLFGLPGGDGLAGGLVSRLGFDRPDSGKDAVNLARDVLDGHHAVDGQEFAPFRIIVNQRLGQRTVARQPLDQHLRGVVDSHVLAARAHFRDPGLDPLQQRALVDPKLDHGVEPHVLLLQEIVQRLRLRHRARKAVEDEAPGRIRLIQPIGNDSDHDLVRHQAAGGHDVLGLQPDR